MMSVLWMRARAQLRGRVGANLFLAVADPTDPTRWHRQLGPAGEGRDLPPRGAVADLLVAGIVRYPKDLLPVVTNQESFLVNSGNLYLTPTYWRRYGARHRQLGIGLAVQLHNGQADLPRLQAGLRRLYGGEAAATDVDASSGDKAITAGTRRAIALESAALAAFAVLTALAALLLVGQTLGRQVLVEAAESPILRALGMTRGQLVGVAVVRAGPVAMAGSALAVVGAVALSRQPRWGRRDGPSWTPASPWTCRC